MDLVHLHGPASADPVCGAPVPVNRRAHLTAYRSDITCLDCVATLRPLASFHRTRSTDGAWSPGPLVWTVEGLAALAEREERQAAMRRHPSNAAEA